MGPQWNGCRVRIVFDVAIPGEPRGWLGLVLPADMGGQCWAVYWNGLRK